jgi:hypothetical protein
MRKGWLKLALPFCLALAGCSSQPPEAGEVASEQLGSDAKVDRHDPAAPGMIPADCEALLNKSQAWGYIPGQKWKPASKEQILEVARFLGEFRLVPPATSDAFLQWDNGGPVPGVEAQLCDPFLAQTFLQAVLDYRWGAQDKAEAGKQIHRFLLNQQALSLPLGHRALSAQIFVGAVNRGLIPGSKAKVKELSSWLEKEYAAATELPPEGKTEAFERKEMVLSGKIRNRLSALLPLP